MQFTCTGSTGSTIIFRSTSSLLGTHFTRRTIMGKRQFLSLRSGQVSKQKEEEKFPAPIIKEVLYKILGRCGQHWERRGLYWTIHWWIFSLRWKWLKRICCKNIPLICLLCIGLLCTGNRPRWARSSLDWASSEYHQEILIKEINNKVLPEIKMIYVLWTLCFRNFIWDTKN